MDVFLDNLDIVGSGLWLTVQLLLAAAVGAFAIGLVVATLRVSPVPVLRAAGTAYVTVVRNTPLPVVFFIIVFGLPQAGVRWSAFFLPAVVSLAIYTGAFVAEVLRAGINSVSAGQAEAARSLGLTFGQTLSVVVLPQAMRTVVPPLGNLWIALAKNTSIASAFGVAELTQSLARLTNSNPATIGLLFGIALTYLVVTIPSGLLFGVLERRVAIVR